MVRSIPKQVADRLTRRVKCQRHLVTIPHPRCLGYATGMIVHTLDDNPEFVNNPEDTLYLCEPCADIYGGYKAFKNDDTSS